MAAPLTVADGFAPITATEMASAAKVAPSPDDGQLIVPIPDDAPPAPSIHSRFGNPSVVWKYRGPDGLLFEVHRFDASDGKQVLPVSYWRDPDGVARWRYKSIPDHRPLYRLDEITIRDDASIVVVEGEKDADAGASIFPASVITTSSGGSQAASKTDWTPLAGRRVLVWPDADDPGAKYGKRVAEILTAQGCEVLVVDAMALASMVPDGGKREPVKGWGAADAAEDWKDNISALRKAAFACAKPFKSGPSFVSYGPYTMGADGLYVEVTRGRGDNKETVEAWVSAPFEILGATRSADGHGWGKWLRWHDGDGREHLRHVPDAMLHGEPSALAALLHGEGLRVNRDQHRALASYLCGATVKKRVTMVGRTGWHVVGNHEVFVLPGGAIGPRGAETVILEAAAVGPYDAKGSLEKWQTGIADLAADHALPVLAISAALAGPLLHLAGQEGGGLHFYGNSSRGKSTLLLIAASVWGRGGSPGYVRAWRATANGLEGAAASASDTVLILDEMGVVDARDAAAAIYSLANGSGKARSARDGSLREPKTWRVLVLSSGEFTMATKLAEDKGRRVRAGQLVRLLDVPIDRGFGYDTFDNAGPDGDAGALARAFKVAATTAYGTAGPAFIRALIDNGVDGEAIRALVSEFVAAEVPRGADGQVDRAAQRFGLIMAAGELAIAFGIVPWRASAAREAAGWALGQWIAGRGGSEPAEVRQAIEAVRLIIQQHGESRFEAIGGDGDGDARPVHNRLGWRTGDGTDRKWLIPSEVWRSEICAGMDAKFVARALGERGMIEPAKDGWQPVRKISGRPVRVYEVLASIFEGAEDGD